MSDDLTVAAPEAVKEAAKETVPSPETAPPATADALMVVVASRVKEVVKSRGLRSDGALADAVNARVITMIAQAADRAKAEGRATVRPHDLAA